MMGRSEGFFGLEIYNLGIFLVQGVFWVSIYVPIRA